MPRANRYLQPGEICHLTHRCHNGEFLFRFCRDREEYWRRLRAAIKEFGVFLLNYCITMNHSHLVAIEAWEGGISEMMQKLEGEHAGYYNRRKDRKGAFWADRFHCTMVEDGAHLMNCLVYVDLNMVRAGVVSHPSEWRWCGYQELIGSKTRFRVLSIPRVLDALGFADPEQFRRDYEARVCAAIQGGQLAREPVWTESVAVGSESYVRRIAKAAAVERREVEISPASDGSWSLRETIPFYGLNLLRRENGLENRE